MRLTELTIERPTVTVQLRGFEVTLRALTSAEREAMTQQYPAPRMPQRTVQDKLGKRYIDDPHQPDYVQKVMTRNQVLCAAMVAVAMNGETDLGSWSAEMKPDAALKWMQAASAELDARLSDATMEHLYGELLKLEKSEFTIGDRVGSGDTQGNSSDQSAEPSAPAGSCPTTTA